MEFSRRPLLPPSRLRVNLETGASGTVSKVVRMLAVDGVDVADEVDVDLAVEGGDDVGELSVPPLARR